MKYITLKVMPKLNNEIGDIVDVGGEEKDIQLGIDNGFLELCEDQSVKNKHVLFFVSPLDIKLTVNQLNNG